MIGGRSIIYLLFFLFSKKQMGTEENVLKFALGIFVSFGTYTSFFTQSTHSPFCSGFISRCAWIELAEIRPQQGTEKKSTTKRL